MTKWWIASLFFFGALIRKRGFGWANWVIIATISQVFYPRGTEGVSGFVNQFEKKQAVILMQVPPPLWVLISFRNESGEGEAVFHFEIDCCAIKPSFFSVEKEKYLQRQMLVNQFRWYLACWMNAALRVTKFGHRQSCQPNIYLFSNVNEDTSKWFIEIRYNLFSGKTSMPKELINGLPFSSWSSQAKFAQFFHEIWW